MINYGIVRNKSIKIFFPASLPTLNYFYLNFLFGAGEHNFLTWSITEKLKHYLYTLTESPTPAYQSWQLISWKLIWKCKNEILTDLLSGVKVQVSGACIRLYLGWWRWSRWPTWQIPRPKSPLTLIRRLIHIYIIISTITGILQSCRKLFLLIAEARCVRPVISPDHDQQSVIMSSLTHREKWGHHRMPTVFIHSITYLEVVLSLILPQSF